MRLQSIILCVLFLLLQGCSKPDQPLSIAAHSWPGYELMFLAEDLGLLSNDNVNLVRTTSATESMLLLEQGHVSGAALTMDEVLRAREKGIELSIVLIFDESAGADALMVKPGITKLSELKGKRLGVERSAVGELMLYKVLQVAGLTKDDVNIVDVPVSEHVKIWKKLNLDAVISYHPVIQQLENIGLLNLFDSRDTKDLIYDVLAVRQEVFDQYEIELKGLIDAHFDALEHWKNNPEDAGYRMAGNMKIPGDHVIGLYRGIEMIDRVHNRKYIMSGRFRKSLDTVSEILLKEKLLLKKDPMQNIVNHEFL